MELNELNISDQQDLTLAFSDCFKAHPPQKILASHLIAGLCFNHHERFLGLLDQFNRRHLAETQMCLLHDRCTDKGLNVISDAWSYLLSKEPSLGLLQIRYDKVNSFHY